MTDDTEIVEVLVRTQAAGGRYRSEGMTLSPLEWHQGRAALLEALGALLDRAMAAGGHP